MRYFFLVIVFVSNSFAGLVIDGLIPTTKGGTGDASPWYISAALDGANPDLGLTAKTAYTEIIDATLTLRPVSGSQAVGVMCSTTNAATAPSTGTTTCAAGSESVGINFTIPDANSAYEVCFYGSHWVELDSNDSIANAFELIETPTNAQTLTLESGNVVISGGKGILIAGGVTSTLYHPLYICSIFKWASTGTKGIRLMYELAVAGTPNVNKFLADLDANTGQRNMSWRVSKIH